MEIYIPTSHLHQEPIANSKVFFKTESRRNFPIIVLGWLVPDIIKKNLASINNLRGVNPEIYFIENYSKNSKEIKKLICSTNNIKGYIQTKENFGFGVWKIALEHFLPLINNEFVTLTDGDYIFDMESMEKQYELFDKYDDIGIISQKRSFLGMSERLRELVHGGYENNRVDDKRNSRFLTRSIFNGIHLTTARKQDWQRYMDHVTYGEVIFTTWELPEDGLFGACTERAPLFWDMDIYRFFEVVFNKSSFLIESEPSYHMTDEYDNPESEYRKEKENGGCFSSIRKKMKHDIDYYHDKFYPNGSLKYNIIIGES